MAVVPVPSEPPVNAHLAAEGLECALSDLGGDLGELSFLCRVAEERLAGLEAVLTDACPHPATRDLLGRTVASARRRYRVLSGRLGALLGEAQYAPRSRSLVERVAAERASLADRLRVEQALLAGLVAAPDWQSPSFLHSLAPAAGRQAGLIRAHWNDYKRDRHVDAEEYERCYVEEMIDGPPGPRALLTGCGMAAFTTILGWLLGEGKASGRVLAGRGLYHESRLLLERMLPGRVCFADEADTATLLRTIGECRPSVVFLDSLSNTPWMPMPDLGAVIDALRGTDTYLVLDNTCLSVGCQPFALACESVRLVVFESLLKYAQLGLDRVAAGVIVARSRDAESLENYREHLGTNIPDLSVHALPPPDRAVLERRLARLERNALHLARGLDESAPPEVSVVYPERGGCVSVLFEEGEERLERQHRVVCEAVAEASRRGIRLLAGSSFGFDTTRIYLTAARAQHGTPFVRIAAGIDHRLELDALTDVLATAIETSASPPFTLTAR
ncbi:MAG TPA: PLP-dependent transferase [Solirubrobacteraceae bacterium]|nr:PLP-dependent transferase [Solirubrobacteraceae bacterium]